MIPNQAQFPQFTTGNIPWPQPILRMNKKNYGNLIEALTLQTKLAKLAGVPTGAVTQQQIT